MSKTTENNHNSSIDYFNAKHIDKLPANVRSIVTKYARIYLANSGKFYKKNIEQFLLELKPLKYTFSYKENNEVFNLRNIKTTPKLLRS